MSESFYLYGVIDGGAPPKTVAAGIGQPPSPVLVRPCTGFALVYSELTADGYTFSVSDVRAHQAVLEGLMSERTVLPFTFGTVAAGAAALEELAAQAGPDITERLERLRGRLEVGLKVFWIREAMREAIGAPSPGRAPSAPAERYGTAIRVGQAVEEQVRRWREEYVPQMTAILAPLYDDVAEGQMVAPTMLWNASFLIERGRQPEFAAAVAELNRRFGHHLDFRHAGPFPPYSFVHLRVGPAREEGAP